MKALFNLFFCLFWLISIPVLAQNNPITTKKDGLTVVKFKTKEGTVTINLPDNIYAGDVISGTVIAEPGKKRRKNKSKKEQKKEKEALEKLQKLNLSIFDTTTQIANNQFSFTVPKNVLSGVVEVKLSDDEMEPIDLTSIIVHNIPRALTKIPLQVPNYLRSGYPQQIVGHFDGDFTTSSIQLNNSPLEIIAESPEGIIVAIPENLVGIQELEISKNEFDYTTHINIVDLNLTADKMSLSRGESTTIHLEVIGIENLGQPVLIHVDNLTPNSITLQQGNHQELFIEPEMVNEQGVFTTDYQISAQQAGGFSISVQLQESELQYADIPAPDELNPSGPNADEKPETIDNIKREGVPPPDELNPAGPNADEKPNSRKIGDDRLASIIPEKNTENPKAEEATEEVKKICGKVKTKKKKTGAVRLQEMTHQLESYGSKKCPSCKENTKWNKYKTNYVLVAEVKWFEGICPLQKGHEGEHKNLKQKNEYQTIKTYKDVRVMSKCSKCGKTYVKINDTWKEEKKWRNKIEKKYHKKIKKKIKPKK